MGCFPLPLNFGRTLILLFLPDCSEDSLTSPPVLALLDQHVDGRIGQVSQTVFVLLSCAERCWVTGTRGEHFGKLYGRVRATEKI